MVMNSFKMYGMAFVVLGSFSLACGMEEVMVEEINFLPRPAAVSRVVSVSPRVSRKKQDKNQEDVKSNSASPNLLRKVLVEAGKGDKELFEKTLLSRVSPVRGRKSNKGAAVKAKQLSMLKSAKKA